MIRPRAVFDCNTLLQALISDSGPAAEALRLLEKNRFELCISRAVLREIRAVLHYENVRRKNPEMTDLDIESFLNRLMFRATLVRRVRHVFDYPRARQDEPYIDLAVTAKAQLLATRAKDLLSLMTGHSLICKQFRRKSHPLRVVNPVEFLTILNSARK